MLVQYLGILPLLACQTLASTGQQVAFQASQPNVDPSSSKLSTLTSTVVDVLSADADFSTLVRLLQRAKLIPALNRLENTTLFAPTNDAFQDARHRLGFAATAVSAAEGTDSNFLSLPDNVLFDLRQMLFYHLLNFTLLSDVNLLSDSAPPDLFPSTGPPLFLETLLYPTNYTGHETPEPAPAPPWLPTPDGQLGGRGQRLRAYARSDNDVSVGDATLDLWVGVDGHGHGGVRVDGQPRTAGNGVVYKIQGVLETPRDIAATILAHPSLSYLSSLLLPIITVPPSPIPPNSYLGLLQSLPNLTVFAPSDKAWSTLPPIERTYLESGLADEDVALLVSFHASRARKDRSIGWRETFMGGVDSVEMLGGVNVSVKVEDSGDMRVTLVESSNDSKGGNDDKKEVEVVEPDVLCENGVIHIVDDLLIPRGAFKLTTEKTLIGLEARPFVDLIRATNLTHYVDASASGESYTILAPKNPRSDPSTSSPHLESLLRYHILPGRLRPKDLADGSLITTELKLPSLKNGRQVLEVSLTDSLGMIMGRTAHNSVRIDRGDGSEMWKDLRFGNVEVLGEPIEVGRSIIYLVDDYLRLPKDFVQTAVSNLETSTFVASVFTSGLEKELKAAPGISLFIPLNHAFTRLGLTMSYLLLPEAKSQLRQLIRYHAVDQVLYTEDLNHGEGGRRRGYLTLEGGSLYIDQDQGNVTVGGETIEGSGEKVNGELKDAVLLASDWISSNGVVHFIDQVELPSSVDITLADLLRGGKSTIMAELLVHAGLDWVLNSTEPSLSELAHLGLTGWGPTFNSDSLSSDPIPFPLSFTLLTPTDAAFAHVNLTAYLSSPDLLLDLLKLHIIPSLSPEPANPRSASKSRPISLPVPLDGRPLSLKDDVAYLTLLSATSPYGDLAFREEASGYVVGIKGARGVGDGVNDWATVLGGGRATPKWKKEGGGDSEEVQSRQTTLSRNKDVRLVNGVTRGGGVILIDAVLIPFQPSWVMVWGWTVLLVVIFGIAALTGIGLLAWWLWQRRVRRQLIGADYEPLENEEN